MVCVKTKKKTGLKFPRQLTAEVFRFHNSAVNCQGAFE